MSPLLECTNIACIVRAADDDGAALWHSSVKSHCLCHYHLADVCPSDTALGLCTRDPTFDFVVCIIFAESHVNHSQKVLGAAQPLDEVVIMYAANISILFKC